MPAFPWSLWSCLAAATALGLLPLRALAAEEPDTRRELRKVIFGSLEAGPARVFGASGVKRMIGSGLDESGVVLMTLSGTGLSRERVPGAVRPVHRSVAQGAVFGGYQWLIDGGVVMALAGAEVDSERVVEEASQGRPRTGAKLLAEVWYRPGPETLLAATAILGTARGSAWVRGAWGWQLAEGLYFGPEATAYGEGRYREGRLGLHLTGITLGPVTLRLSAGWSVATQARPGLYVGVGSHFRM